jgi:hypothetical protein
MAAASGRAKYLRDLAASGDLVTIVAISRQVPWLAKTIKAILAGRSLESQTHYTPWRTLPILVPLEPKRGASELPPRNQARLSAGS